MPSFSIRVAGAFYYRPAVLRCRLRDVVTLVHEPDNKYDYNAAKTTVRDMLRRIFS